MFSQNIYFKFSFYLMIFNKQWCKFNIYPNPCQESAMPITLPYFLTYFKSGASTVVKPTMKLGFLHLKFFKIYYKYISMVHKSVMLGLHEKLFSAT